MFQFLYLSFALFDSHNRKKYLKKPFLNVLKLVDFSFFKGFHLLSTDHHYFIMYCLCWYPVLPFNFTDGSLESLQILINFMYTGCLLLSENNILITLGLATQLDVPEAIELCQQFLQDVAKKTRSLDSISSRLKPDQKSLLDVAVKQELVENDDYDMSLSWDRDCSLSYKLNTSERLYQKRATDVCEEQVIRVQCDKERGNKRISQRLVKQGIPKSKVDKKNHRVRRKKESPSSATAQKQQLCHVCLICSKSFQWQSTLTLHQKSHWFILYANLEVNHMISQSKQTVVSMATGQQTCTVCQQTFPCASAYRGHLLTLHKDQVFKYVCRKCPYKRFQYRKHLYMHNVIQHSTSHCSKLAKCPLCPRYFLYKRSLLLHKYSVHASTASLSHLRFSLRQKKRGQQSHYVNSATTARWKCEEKNCHCAFNSKNKLIEHVTMVHPQAHYICPMNRCKFSTVIKLLLER